MVFFRSLYVEYDPLKIQLGKTLFIIGTCKDNDKKGCVDMIQNNKPSRAFIL